MKLNESRRIKTLLDRIVRASASQDWGDGLNPAQRAVLVFLSSANQFSRAPSNIAQYMCTTRGTTSQTLKALERKELVSQSVSPTDKRSISYDITPLGRKTLSADVEFDTVLDSLSNQEASALLNSLESVAHRFIAARGYMPFGICNRCEYHEKKGTSGFCSLLQIQLTNKEATQLCHEQLPVDSRK